MNSSRYGSKFRPSIHNRLENSTSSGSRPNSAMLVDRCRSTKCSWLPVRLFWMIVVITNTTSQA
ncbi:Uncharacterised protein [Mycobacterium tuberculosis]|uniref:Uncharacterized protein n=2 Tax=Mycobacterium tuberculosis TaxID=1773 RepID=A0A654U595_MYCTX|nr:Uncharacterised protein [Mycobacterium tuberculosis]CFC43100.1 Uncharacterised protein [Mycobacterium tuberculosis]CFC77966.1 Uncharacterised protein [Mycobacterium tuberculosis]CFC86049.1 Uncharacterised protein [Mycobacterium tuberculosis]CFD23674.1 Uncharacterised protein [Mycobacterium tuberculosis]